MPEVLFLVTCASIAGCDDYDEIANWGAHHLAFLRQHGEYDVGTPKQDRLRTVLNRIDPALFETCFMSWATCLRPDAPTPIALDGKALRRSGDSAGGRKPLHLASAWASTQRPVLSQQAVDAQALDAQALDAKENEGAWLRSDRRHPEAPVAESSPSRQPGRSQAGTPKSSPSSSHPQAVNLDSGPWGGARPALDAPAPVR